MLVRMWEARCADGRVAEAVDWVRHQVAADARSAGAQLAEVFRSENRVVLITRWPVPTSWVEPAGDPAVVLRADVWFFELVDDG